MIHRHLPDALFVIGALAVPIGVGLVYVPAGVVVGGLELLVLGFVMARGQHGRPG